MGAGQFRAGRWNESLIPLSHSESCRAAISSGFKVAPTRSVATDGRELSSPQSAWSMSGGRHGRGEDEEGEGIENGDRRTQPTRPHAILPALRTSKTPPPPAEHVGQHGDPEKHDQQAQLVRLVGPAEQGGVGQFVDEEAARRDRGEAHRRAPHRHAVPLEGHPVVAEEGHLQRDDPAQHVGDQRMPVQGLDDRRHHQPVHERSGAADGDEAGNAAGVNVRHRASRVNGGRQDAPAERRIARPTHRVAGSPPRLQLGGGATGS